MRMCKGRRRVVRAPDTPRMEGLEGGPRSRVLRRAEERWIRMGV